MARRFQTTIVVNRPIEDVFDFLAEGENDKKFSARVLEIKKTTEGPPGKGTVFASTVKDAGMKSNHEFELVEFERPTKLRWNERSSSSVTVPLGGYDLKPSQGGTELTFFNELEGHGLGKLFAGLAARGASRSAAGMVAEIKRVMEAS
jgi:uncharacterized protein YndB with AHSA1/START domain